MPPRIFPDALQDEDLLRYFQAIRLNDNPPQNEAATNPTSYHHHPTSEAPAAERIRYPDGQMRPTNQVTGTVDTQLQRPRNQATDNAELLHQQPRANRNVNGEAKPKKWYLFTHRSQVPRSPLKLTLWGRTITRRRPMRVVAKPVPRPSPQLTLRYCVSNVELTRLFPVAELRPA